LFDHPVVRADASALPVGDESFDGAWALGVLCTTDAQLELLRELRRVTRPPGRVGLLVLVARVSTLDEQPEGNHFPTVEALSRLVDEAGLRIEARCGTSDLDPVPDDWSGRVDAVTAELSARYGGHRAWRQAEHQSDLIGKLMADQLVSAELLSLRHSELGIRNLD
jgi:SAM-dependent methyltransferase